MEDFDIKRWWTSIGVWGSITAVLAGVFGYTLTPADQAQIMDSASHLVALATQAASVVGGLLALWGRVRATKRIG